ncbi:MAG TPA: hypothetical protein VE987_03075 [Polyangiaceae bacterium]|nr:hypothetical protein [Polyangiaceae bacterium]
MLPGACESCRSNSGTWSAWNNTPPGYQSFGTRQYTCGWSF